MSQEVQKITFTEEGTYVYQCTPHLMMAMVGLKVITVGDASVNLSAVKDAANEKKSVIHDVSSTIRRIFRRNLISEINE